MKRILLLFVLVSIFSCTSDEKDESVDIYEGIYRKWFRPSTFQSSYCTNGVRDYLVLTKPNKADYFYSVSNCENEFAKEPFTFIKNGSVLTFYYWIY